MDDKTERLPVLIITRFLNYEKHFYSLLLGPKPKALAASVWVDGN